MEKINSSIETIEKIITSRQYAKQQIETLEIANQGIEGEIHAIDDNQIQQMKESYKTINAQINKTNTDIFEAKAFKAWEKHINLLGNKLEIHAGIPGPANLKTLISYAKSCGIGNSIKFLSQQAFNITKIATSKKPDKLIADLAEYKFNTPSSKLTKIHLYPFGGMKKTSQWMNTILDNPLKIKSNNEFEIIIPK